MNEKVCCPFCRFFGEPERTKISNEKNRVELTCSRCGNVIRYQYKPKAKVEKRCER